MIALNGHQEIIIKNYLDINDFISFHFITKDLIRVMVYHYHIIKLKNCGKRQFVFAISPSLPSAAENVTFKITEFGH